MAGIFTNLFTKKKPKSGGLFIPAFLRKVKSGAQLSDDRRNRTNEDLTQIRYGASTEEVIRNYIKNSPDVSHATESIMRFAITDSFTLVANNLLDDTISPEATRLVQMFAARLNKLPIRMDGFSPQMTINAISESLITQLLGNGTCMAELVLDKTLLPSHIQPVSTNNLKYQSDGDRVVPFIQDTGAPIYLDAPTICIISLSQDPESPYATSWFKAAVQPITSSTEFTNDLRRSFRKASLPRVKATISTENFLATLPPEVQFDAKKRKEAIESMMTMVEEKLNGLNPEDAITVFDIIDVQHLTAGSSSSHENVKVHADLINGQMSAGLHTLPSILGRGESQTTASTETVLFLKMVESIQGRLNELFSYLFTMAVRLQGYDVTVSFRYKKPSLRPENEEESFLAMRQSRIRQNLSDGFISDEEASILLTGNLPSGDFTPLSGTGFFGKSAATTIENPYSNTSVDGKQLNNTQDQKNRKQGTTKPKTNGTTG